MRNHQGIHLDAAWTKRADFNMFAARFHISPVTARIIRNRDVEGRKPLTVI